MDKNLLRKKNLNLRKTLDCNLASSLIVAKILSSEFFLNSKNVLIFYPMKFEINLLELLKVEDKNFYLPRVFGKELLICPYTENLKKSPFGVMEPLTEPVCDISVIDTAFIPCLAIDKNLNRIGYGKGFYDRLFSDSRFSAKKIAVLYKELVVNKINTDKFDRKVDFLITD